VLGRCEVGAHGARIACSSTIPYFNYFGTSFLWVSIAGMGVVMLCVYAMNDGGTDGGTNLIFEIKFVLNQLLISK
jgi:hypothetical protein